MQKIIVKRFMALTGETTIELKNMLVIIGEQASGKSSLAKLIYFFRSLRQDFLYAAYDNLDSQENISVAFLKAVRDKFYNFFGSTRHLDDFEVTFYYSSSKYIRISLYPENKGLKIFLSSALNNVLFSDVRQYVRAMSNVASRKDAYELLAFQEAVNRTEQFIASVFDDDSQPLFIPAGRTITVSYPDQFKLNFYRGLKNDVNGTIDGSAHPPSTDLYLMTAFINHVEKMIERFSGFDFYGVVSEYIARDNEIDRETIDLALEKIQKILRGEYRSDHFGEKIFFNAENFVLPNKASSGQQEVIRILQDIFLVLLDQQKAFRVMEEPEAHLYPLAQKQVIEMIALMLNSTDSEIVITTHSPYVLSVLNNLLFAARVAQKSESAYQQTAEILNPLLWLDANKCNVYSIKNGKCISIYDNNTGLIEQNYLDEISEELGADFDQLYDIYGSLVAK